MTLPIGTQVERVEVDASSFLLPGDTSLSFEGVTLTGTLSVKFSHRGIDVRVPSFHAGSILSAGQSHESGTFDTEHHEWRFDQ